MNPVNKLSSVRNLVIAITLLIACSLFQACKKEATLTPAQQVAAILTASPWKVQSVTVDGASSSLFTNFTITFGASTFTTVNGGEVWPSSSSWVFTDVNASAFTRGDGLTVQLTEVTSTSLKMRLTWSKNTFGPGRVSSISGQHNFVMGK